LEPRYITWNFANFVTVNLMIAVLAGMVILMLRWKTQNGAAAA
jgi:hypothetical protein